MKQYGGVGKFDLQTLPQRSCELWKSPNLQPLYNHSDIHNLIRKWFDVALYKKPNGFSRETGKVSENVSAFSPKLFGLFCSPRSNIRKGQSWVK